MDFETRKKRAQTIFDMSRKQGMRQVDIADAMGLSRSSIVQELKWFINGPGKASEEEWKKEKEERIVRRQAEHAAVKAQHIAKRNELTKSMMQMVIDGKTVKDAAESFNLSPMTASNMIRNYQKVDPVFFEEYKAAARTHHFGYWHKAN